VMRCSIGTWWYIGEMKGWIPAYAEEHHSYCREILVRSTPQKHPSPYTKRLGGMGKKCSGGGQSTGKDRDGLVCCMQW
jgi:hypothetical protein